jgi:hypothetical protein
VFQLIFFLLKVTTDLQETKSRVRDKIAEGDLETESKGSRSRSSHTSSDHRSNSDEKKSSVPFPRNEESKKKKSSSAPKHPPPPSFADLVRAEVR